MEIHKNLILAALLGAFSSFSTAIGEDMISVTEGLLEKTITYKLT